MDETKVQLEVGSRVGSGCWVIFGPTELFAVAENLKSDQLDFLQLLKF
jgi:hypothetical protein